MNSVKETLLLCKYSCKKQFNFDKSKIELVKTPGHDQFDPSPACGYKPLCHPTGQKPHHDHLTVRHYPSAHTKNHPPDTNIHKPIILTKPAISTNKTNHQPPAPTQSPPFTGMKIQLVMPPGHDHHHDQFGSRKTNNINEIPYWS
jgi:hypothetical protein